MENFSLENFSMVDFNYFDVTIASIVLILGIKGFVNGFIKEFFGLLGVVGGVYFASRFAGETATFISANFLPIENEALLKLVGFLAVLTVIWLSATIVGALLSKLTSASGLGFLNRLFGFIAGGGKYFLIFALIVTALSNVTLVQDKIQKYLGNSILYPYLKEVGTTIINIDPEVLELHIKKPATPTTPTQEVQGNTTESNATVVPTEYNQSLANY